MQTKYLKQDTRSRTQENLRASSTFHAGTDSDNLRNGSGHHDHVTGTRWETWWAPCTTVTQVLQNA